MPYREESRKNLRRTPSHLRCTDCGTLFPRGELHAKRVAWSVLGTGKHIKSRTTAHQCVTCMNLDKDFQRELLDAPGLNDVKEKRA